MDRRLDFLDNECQVTNLRAPDGRVIVKYRGKLVPYPPTPEETATLIRERDTDPRRAAIRRELEEAQKAHEEKWREINAREEQERATARQSFQECDVDSMTGEDFEQFLIRLFEKMGYVAVQVTSTMRPDFGVDIILRDHQDKPSLMIAVQAKRYTGNVGIEAVQEVFAGKRHHGCKKAVLVTNSAFSAAAMELAKSTGVTLIDGEALQKLCFEQSHRPFG